MYIPSCCMSTFLLPVSLSEELQRIMNSFWWGKKKEGKRSIHWMRWGSLCERKVEDRKCSHINVRNDPWLRCDQNFFIESSLDDEFGDLRVCDLFVLGHKEWDVELINGVFKERDAIEIVSIPLYSSWSANQRLWHFSKTGSYSIKSGFRIAMDQLLSNGDERVAGSWDKLWSLVVPPKVMEVM
ncbi:hypothetical protein PTKIN_Ptkin17bG0073100 [Pterospermum kingtungense]